MTDILLACGLTVVIELAFFLIAGYRSRRFIIICVFANVATNLTLNIGLNLLYMQGLFRPWVVYALEIVVVWVEYVIYAIAIGKSRKLFLLTLAANAISYGIGLLVF